METAGIIFLLFVVLVILGGVAAIFKHIAAKKRARNKV